ncbi:MAG TPA: flagellar hook-associated protein FlgK, partial [Clostridia bacterium]|nr:flagellar hook-associated protein FlgK [Clostridia bacterium]
MVTTFWGIEVGSRALRTQQKALDTTGHNIANANTRGYTRQQAIMSPTSPYTMPGFFSPASAGQMGTGVYVQEIRRIRDQFIDLQIRNELESLGYWEQKSTYLEKIGVIFNEPSDSGLRSVFTKFFNALHNLASNADDPTTRTLVIEQGRAVAETFNHMTRQFRDTVMAVDSTLKAKINEINSYARQIRDLNEQIIRIENAGDRANDLRDKRDVLLDDLAKLISIDYMEMEDGSVLVSTGGRSLVQGVYYKELELKIYDSGDLKGQPRIVWKDSGEDYRFVNVKSSSKSGYAQGSALSGTITVDDTNNVFSLIVDGVTRSITIPNGDYDSDDETAMNNLADLLTDEINNTY